MISIVSLSNVTFVTIKQPIVCVQDSQDRTSQFVLILHTRMETRIFAAKHDRDLIEGK